MIRFIVPSKANIKAIINGNVSAPDPWGNFHDAEVYAHGQDDHGRWYVCYRTKFTDNSHITNSLKEGELLRTPQLSCLFTSDELDDIEAALRASGYSITAIPRHMVHDFVKTLLEGDSDA